MVEVIQSPEIVLGRENKLRLLRGAIRRIKRSENRSMMAALSMESNYNPKLPFMPLDLIPEKFPLLKHFWVEVRDSMGNLAAIRYTDELSKHDRIKVLMRIGMAVKYNKQDEDLWEIINLMTR